MKRFMIVVVSLVLVMGLVGSAMAANSMRQGELGISVGVGDDSMIAGKYFVNNDLAALLGFQFMNQKSGTDIGLLVGARKYLKKDDFTPYMEAGVSYMSSSVDLDVLGITVTTDTTVLGLFGNYGFEYFFHKQFSVEGSVGVALESTSVDVGGTSTSSTLLTTRTTGVRATFYF